MARKTRQQITAEAEAAERSLDLAFIKDPYKWPNLLCPIKRYGADRRMQTAYLTGDGPNIYYGNMFSPKKEDRKEEFASYEAIIEAGWVVD